MLTSPRPLCVLIVDDCPDTTASYAELLGLYGHDTRTAQSAREALALCDGWEPDVALVDLWMPRTNGFELARWLRVRGARCPPLGGRDGAGDESVPGAGGGGGVRSLPGQAR